MIAANIILYIENFYLISKKFLKNNTFKIEKKYPFKSIIILYVAKTNFKDTKILRRIMNTSFLIFINYIYIFNKLLF